MRCAFVVVAGSRPTGIPQNVLTAIAGRRPPAELTFEVAHDLHWSNADGSVVVAAWCEGSEDADHRAWRSDGSGVSVCSGGVRRCGTPWDRPTMSAAVLGAALRPFTEAALDDLAGEFSGLVLDPAGSGVVVTDAFAHRGLYVATSRSHDVVASTPALAAAALHGDVAAAPLDPWGVCGLAYTKHRIGNRTGFADVRSLPIGSFLSVVPSRGVTAAPRRPPWDPEPELRAMSERELLDEAALSLREAVEAAGSYPSSLRFMDLTGGKDSRLMLALAMTARVTDQFVFRTDGPSTILDVDIARELAAIAKVRWMDDREVRALMRDRRAAAPCTDRIPKSRTDWNDRMRAFVRSTGGICNIADTGGRASEPDATIDGAGGMVRANGLCGELLRSMLGFELPDETALIRRFDRHFGHLDLLQPEAFRQYRSEWIHELLSDHSPPTTWNDRHDSFLLRTQVRSNFGPRLELSSMQKLMPLSSLRTVRSVYAMRGEARVTERVHREVIERASPEVLEHRLTKGGWRERREAPAWAAPTRRTFRRRWMREVVDSPLDHPADKAAFRPETSLSAADYRRAADGFDDPALLLRDLLADRTNPAWDVLDSVAVTQAVERYGQLSRAAHVELMGAATAAIWLART